MAAVTVSIAIEPANRTSTGYGVPNPSALGLGCPYHDLMTAVGPYSDMQPGRALIDVQIVNGPIEYAAVTPFPQPAGAEAVFIGRTRNEVHPVHGQLVRLSYEAYRPMAERILRQIAQTAVEQFDCLAVRIHHALGDVDAGEASVLVQVVSGHRDAAFDACRFLIDTLKEQAPIWKKEQWENGATWSKGQTVQHTGPPVEHAL